MASMPGPMGVTTVPPTTHCHQPFLAPVPLDWILRAGSLPGKALQVAMIVRHYAALEQKREIILKNKYLRQMSVSSDSKRRALIQLEEAGLVVVTQRVGGNPLVRIID